MKFVYIHSTNISVYGKGDGKKRERKGEIKMKTIEGKRKWEGQEEEKMGRQEEKRRFCINKVIFEWKYRTKTH